MLEWYVTVENRPTSEQGMAIAFAKALKSFYRKVGAVMVEGNYSYQ